VVEMPDTLAEGMAVALMAAILLAVGVAVVRYFGRERCWPWHSERASHLGRPRRHSDLSSEERRNGQGGRLTWIPTYTQH